MNRLPLAVLAALAAVCCAAPASAAAPPGGQRPLRNIDTRAPDGGPVSVQERRAREDLEGSLGDEGIVSTDRITGGARLVARTDGFLTGRRSAPAASIALEYVRTHSEVFGVGAADLAGLRNTRSYSSADGVTHLAWTQTYLGIAAYDNVLLANVGEDGRLVNVGGSAVSGLRVDSIVPDVDAGAALAAARREVGGSLIAPSARQGRGPERPTTFAGGDTARLVLFGDGRTTRLAWRVQVTGAHDWGYEVVVDATSGATLKRRSFTEFATARVYRNHPGALVGGTSEVLPLPLAWVSRSAGSSRLCGDNVHAYVDTGAANVNPVVGQTCPPAGEQEVASSSGADWMDELVLSPTGLHCPPSGCTWDPSVSSSRTQNNRHAAIEIFYLANNFHDHLATDPDIGFTPARGNFEGDDPVMAEAYNFANAPAPSVNNASMTTLPDGTPPRLQAYLFTDPSLNSADTADVIYHEYTHGLTNRSVGSGVGLDANQSRAMGEGWSDWYALDYLDRQGLRPDSGGSSGDMTIGGYLQPGGLRTQGADCPVGPAVPGCPHGGYTLANLGGIATGGGFEVHADGEIWLETLWDIRSSPSIPSAKATAERIITDGLRLAPNNPSFLEARDAIIQADRVATAGANYDALWAIFAARGMGYSASTSSSAATTATAAFDLPPRLVHDTTTVTDSGAGGTANANGVPEPGETVQLTETLRNPHATPTSAISGTLSGTGGVTIGPPATIGWPTILAGASAPSTTPYDVRIPAGANCDVPLALNLHMNSTPSAPGGFDVPLRVPVGSVSSTDVPKIIPALPSMTTSTLTFGGGGTVNGLELRIGRLNHTFVGDLRITLTSPLGRIVPIMDSPGTDPRFGASGDDFVDLVLDDDAVTPIDAIPPTNPPGGYTGRYKPQSPLSVFNGQSWNGTWTLTLIDLYDKQDSGTLVDWGIRPSQPGPCPNRPPVPIPDAYSTGGDQALHAATSVLANDSDPEGTAMTAIKETDPAHGTVALAADGTFTYTPGSAFKGIDSFTYRASDGAAPSAPATVTVDVGNQPPRAVDDSYTTTSGATLNGPTVLANDSDPNGDPLTATLAAGPTHGALSLASNGTVTYTPDTGFSGRDAFTYAASDGTSSSGLATAFLDVAVAPPPPQPPPAPPPAPPAPPPAPPAPPPPPVAANRALARLEVARAGLSAGKLVVQASITPSARGKVRVTYRAGGRTTSFATVITGGRIRVRRTLPAAQRSRPAGAVTLTFAGSALVHPDSVTLAAARGRPRLRSTTSRTDSGGRLRVRGTIAARERGVVRIRFAYVGAGDTLHVSNFTARIARGRWSLVKRLPTAAAKAGGQVSILYTGSASRRTSGQQIAKEVAPGG